MLGSLGKDGHVSQLLKLKAKQSSDDDAWLAEAYRSFRSLMKSRSGKELKNFVSTMKQGSSEDSCCWMLPSRFVEVRGEQVSPAEICARLFRWPELRSQEQLHRLASCKCFSSVESRAESCCNPFHFGKVLSIDVPSIVLDRDTLTTAVHLPAESSSREDSAFYDCTLSSSASVFSEFSVSDKCVALPACSTSDSGRPSRADSEIHSQPAQDASGSWLSMAYWEQNNRLGRQFHVTDTQTSVNYGGTSGFVLGKIANTHRTDGVEKKRRAFGKGFSLWREGDDVWMYNRSEHSVFVQSPSLSSPTGTRKVHRVNQGQVVKVFSRQQAELLLLYLKKTGTIRFPFDVFSFRASLVSGWGERHTRQNIMQCPCWLEFFLSF